MLEARFASPRSSATSRSHQGQSNLTSLVSRTPVPLNCIGLSLLGRGRAVLHHLRAAPAWAKELPLEGRADCARTGFDCAHGGEQSVAGRGLRVARQVTAAVVCVQHAKYVLGRALVGTRDVRELLFEQTGY